MIDEISWDITRLQVLIHQGPLLLTWFNFDPKMDKYSYTQFGEITYPFPNFNGTTVEVWKSISNYIAQFIMDVITYPKQGFKLNHFQWRGPISDVTTREDKVNSLLSKVNNCWGPVDLATNMTFCIKTFTLNLVLKDYWIITEQNYWQNIIKTLFTSPSNYRSMTIPNTE